MLTIPLIDGLIQKVQTTIAGSTYILTTKRNDRTGTYSMDVTVDNNEVLHGIQLLGGVDIFAGFPDCPLNRVYCVNKTSPTLDFELGELGNNNLLVVIEDSDLEE